MQDEGHNVASWIRAHAQAHPNREAVVDDHRRLSYGQFEERCARTAGALSERGIGPGDRVALLLDNRSVALELVFAAARIGAIALPVNTRLAAPEIAQQLDDGRPSLLFHEAALVERAAAACEQASSRPVRIGAGEEHEAAIAAASPSEDILPARPDDPMLLMYTSGTTGVPKGALLPHRKTLANSLNARIFFETTSDDRVLTVVPLYHSFGLKILSIPALYAGACVVLQSRFDPLAMWSAVERERITYLGGVPTMFRELIDTLDEKQSDTRSLRFLFSAGAAIPVELIHGFEERGLRLQQGFGQTETSILCCLGAEDAVRKAGSVGRPVHHAELRIVRVESLERTPAEWEECAAGETGEIVVRGDLTMLGYWERPEATAETLRDGWLRTGDLASRDDEGFVTLTGRARELIISGGENVYPRQVEAVYEEHPDLREIAVVGVSDERWGEVGRAFVVMQPRARLDSETLIAWGRERLASFELPKSFVAVPELPKTVTGKVQKFRLLEREAAAQR